MTRSRLLTLVAVLLLAGPVRAQLQIVASKHADPAPAEIAAPLKGLLADGGTCAQVGEASLTFWWVKALPLAPDASGALEWAKVAEGALVGAVQISTNFRDIRGRTIKPGLYTLRYGIQPANGDHLGVSPYRDFLLLSPAAVDQDPAPTGHDGTIEMSKQTIGGSHPGPWMLDPPTTGEAVLSTGRTDMGFAYVVFELPSAAGALRFGLVLVGKVEA